MPPQWLMLVKLLPAAAGYSLIFLVIRRGMGPRYAAFLALVFLHSTSWLFDGRLPEDYKIPLYVASAVVGWLLYTYIVCEMFGRTFGEFPGIARTGRRVIAISMIAALSASFLTVGQEFGQNSRSMGILIATIGERVVSSAIIVFLILILLFLRWMPVPLAENLVRHTIIFFCYFVSTALLYHYWNRVAGPSELPMVNATSALVSTFAYLAWA